ncbi:MAG: penicillin-binding protein activator LpoB [Opitutaceae bacterium]|nr:penicillin-binding protein activator LpoB [Opitutaceae bacterium]
MNQRTLFVALLGAAALALAPAPASANTVKKVDPKSKVVVNATQISPSEWTEAADKLVTNLLDSEVLLQIEHPPAVMAISRIRNDTTMQIDIASLTKKIRVALNQSGKILTTTTVGLGGQAEDPLAKESAEYAQFMGGQKQETKMPDYTLSGKIQESRIKQGRETLITYTFQLSLTEVRSGLAVWEAEEAIAKTSKKSVVGW